MIMNNAAVGVVVAALYRFAKFPDCQSFREPLLAIMHAHEVRGTLLLAAEGINGTIAGNTRDAAVMTRTGPVVVSNTVSSSAMPMPQAVGSSNQPLVVEAQISEISPSANGGRPLFARI